MHNALQYEAGNRRFQNGRPLCQPSDRERSIASRMRSTRYRRHSSGAEGNQAWPLEIFVYPWKLPTHRSRKVELAEGTSIRGAIVATIMCPPDIASDLQ